MSPESRRPADEEISQIPEVLTFFGLGKMSKASLLSGGDANHNYAVLASGKEYVVRFPIEESKESLENDFIIATQLHAAGIGAPIYLHSADGRFIYEGEKMAVVSPLIEGVSPERITEEQALSIGNILGEFHLAVRSIVNSHKGWLNPETVNKTIPQESDPLVQKAREFIGEGSDIFSQELPKGIIHGDLHEGNLLVDPEDPKKINAVFDFEEAEGNILLLDIARTMLAVCVSEDGPKIDENLAGSFILGYLGARQMTEAEKANLPKAVKYVAAACILWYMKNGFLDRAEKAISRVESLDEVGIFKPS